MRRTTLMILISCLAGCSVELANAPTPLDVSPTSSAPKQESAAGGSSASDDAAYLVAPPSGSDTASGAATGATTQAGNTADEARTNATETATETAGEATETATETAGEGTETATGTASDATETATETAAEGTETATETAGEGTETAIETATEGTEAAIDAADAPTETSDDAAPAGGPAGATSDDAAEEAEAVTPTTPPACNPMCEGATCGDDGCGGSCGDCAGDETCAGGECISDTADCQAMFNDCLDVPAELIKASCQLVPEACLEAMLATHDANGCEETCTGEPAPGLSALCGAPACAEYVEMLGSVSGEDLCAPCEEEIVPAPTFACGAEPSCECVMSECGVGSAGGMGFGDVGSLVCQLLPTECWESMKASYLAGGCQPSVCGGGGVAVASLCGKPECAELMDSLGAFMSDSDMCSECQGECVPQCDGASCGDDGCGGSCGACATGASCSAVGQCALALYGGVTDYEEAEPNSVPGSAQLIDTGADGFCVVGTLPACHSGGGDDDIFQFVAAQTGPAVFTLTWDQAADLDLYLTGSDGGTIFGYEDATSTFEQHVADVTAGATYQLNANCWESDIEQVYELCVEF